MYIYLSCLGNLYASSDEIDERYCEQCFDYDDYVGFAESREEAEKVIREYNEEDCYCSLKESLIIDFLNSYFPVEAETPRYIYAGHCANLLYASPFALDSLYRCSKCDNDDIELGYVTSREEAEQKISEFEKKTKRTFSKTYLANFLKETFPEPQLEAAE